ncbi:MAG: hypothetical protein ACLU4J_17280 [Butyricimonas paravirosa]
MNKLFIIFYYACLYLVGPGKWGYKVLKRRRLPGSYLQGYGQERVSLEQFEESTW